MTAVQTSARDFFRAAYENRYTWDKSFPGYTADVTFKEGDVTQTGKVTINSKLAAEVTGFDDENAKKAVEEQAWEIAVHRVRRNFEDTHGKNTFEFGATDETGAVEILLGGKSAGDRYKVRDNVVTLVHRHIHNIVVTINTTAVQNTDEGYLSHQYDAVYHDPQTGEQKGEPSDFEDSYERVGNYYILNRRVIRTTENGQAIASEFIFSNIQLLEPAA